MITPMTDAARIAHNAAYAIPALLSDGDLIDAWRAHWSTFSDYAEPGLWFDRFTELLDEVRRRGLLERIRNNRFVS